MIIIELTTGIKLQYKGKISLVIDEEFPKLLWVTANHSKCIVGYEIWHSDTWDNIYLKDIKSIKGEYDSK